MQVLLTHIERQKLNPRSKNNFGDSEINKKKALSLTEAIIC